MTLIYQSYRTENVPPWIAKCMGSVKKWAVSSGFDYRFIDDSLFNHMPDWYQVKVNHNVQLVSDLARLIMARKFLNEGYERVIWLDADMLVFAPELFSLDNHDLFSFCRETWLDEDQEKNIIHQENVNNSVSIFQKGNTFLDFYIDACLKIVESRGDFEPVTVGTAFLTALNELCPLPLVHHVGIISPALVYALVREDFHFIDEYVKRHGSPVYAANLCDSKKDTCFRDLKIDDDLMAKVAVYLLNKKGFKPEFYPPKGLKI